MSWKMVDEGWGRRAADFATIAEPSNCREYVAMHTRVGLGTGDHLLDVAGGSGLALELARARGAECAGIDASQRLVDIARFRNPDCDVRVGDMHDLPWEDRSFDVATVAFGLRNMESWEQGLRSMMRMVRTGGRVVVLDFSLPTGALRRPYAWYLNKVLPRIAGVLTGQRGAYEYLAGSIERFPSGPSMRELFAATGMPGAEWIPLSGGIAAVYVGEVRG